MRHVSAEDLALYASGDLGWWMWPVVRMHAARCAVCRSRVEAHRGDRDWVRDLALELPAGTSWESLSAEMNANIRVGLAAGECVTPRSPCRSIPMGWRVAGVSAGFVALLAAAWWINLPASQTVSLAGAVKSIARGTSWQGRGPGETGPVVRAAPSGIELRDDVGALAISAGEPAQGEAPGGIRPASVTLGVQGSARAYYVDAESGQVTITSVYAQ